MVSHFQMFESLNKSIRDITRSSTGGPKPGAPITEVTVKKKKKYFTKETLSSPIKPDHPL